MSYIDLQSYLQERNVRERAEKKRKLAELLDKYGESKEAIDKNADVKDSFEYMLANQNGLIDEVLNERRREREKSNFPQTPYPLATRKNPNYVVPKNLPKTEEDDVMQDRLRKEKRNMLLERG